MLFSLFSKLVNFLRLDDVDESTAGGGVSSSDDLRSSVPLLLLALGSPSFGFVSAALSSRFLNV